MNPYELTGKVRLRSERRWGRERLIVQVQERYLRSDNYGGFIDSSVETRWRDAGTEDVTDASEIFNKGS